MNLFDLFLNVTKINDDKNKFILNFDTINNEIKSR